MLPVAASSGSHVAGMVPQLSMNVHQPDRAELLLSPTGRPHVILTTGQTRPYVIRKLSIVFIGLSMQHSVAEQMAYRLLGCGRNRGLLRLCAKTRAEENNSEQKGD